MPLPSPKGKEKQSDFVSRCMGDNTMGKDFENQKQRAAVCYSLWEKAKASADVVLGSEGNEILIINEAAQKTYGGKKRSELKDSDFLFPETRSFPIVSPQDVRDAISNFGRMGGNMSYDAFVKKLYRKAKSKGQEFVNAIPESTKKEHNLTASEDSLEEYKMDFFHMSLGSLNSIKKHAENIIAAIDSPMVKENLTEPWLQGKIAITEDYMLAIHNYIMFVEENKAEAKEVLAKKIKSSEDEEEDEYECEDCGYEGEKAEKCPNCGSSNYKSETEEVEMNEIDDAGCGGEKNKKM
jgi:hypothetical protein